jgi:hypothetical protein
MTTENEGGGSSRIDEVNIERADLAERAVGCARGLPPIDRSGSSVAIAKKKRGAP